MLIAPGDAVALNVGGQRFLTSRTTLRNGAPAFCDMLAEHPPGGGATVADDRSVGGATCSPPEYLIDRSPQRFPAILAFLRNGTCVFPDTIRELLELQAEAEAYRVHGLWEAIDKSASMRVHRRLAGESRSRESVQLAANGLLVYAFGPEGTNVMPGTTADAATVDVRVALAATAPVQGRYRCRLEASVSGPGAVNELRHEYDAAGEQVEPPLAASNLRSPFYAELAPEQQAVWDKVRFLRKNADAVASAARQGSCFRVGLKLLTPEAAEGYDDAQPAPSVLGKHAKRAWRLVYDSTLRFEVQLV